MDFRHIILLSSTTDRPATVTPTTVTPTTAATTLTATTSARGKGVTPRNKSDSCNTKATSHTRSYTATLLLEEQQQAKWQKEKALKSRQEQK